MPSEAPAGGIGSEPPESATARPRGGAFVRDSASIALGQYVARAMVLARGWAAAVALGPLGFGSWTVLNLIFDYGSYASLGALQGLDLALPAALASGDGPRARRLMSGAWTVAVAGGAAFAIATALALRWGPKPAAWPGTGPALLMLAAALLQLVFQYLATTLRAHGRFGAVSAGQTVQATLGAGLGLALVWRLGLWGLLAGWLAGTVVALVLMRRAGPEAPLRPGGSGGEGVRLTRLGAPIFGYFVASLVLRSVDRLALARYGNAHQLGLYGVALLASGLALFVPEAAGYVLFPRVAAAYHGDVDRERVRADVVRVQRALAVTMPLLVGLAIVWAGPMVEWLLPGYRPAIPALRLLAAGALALSAATVPGYFLLGCGRQHTLLALGVLAAAINGVLVFTVAAREADPARVALAAGVGYVIFALLILARAGRELGAAAGGRARFVTASLGPAAWGSALALALVRLLPGRGFTWAFVASDLFALGYLPLLLAMARGLGMRQLVRETLAPR